MSEKATDIPGVLAEDRRVIRWLLRLLAATLILFAIFGFMVRYNQVKQNRIINNLSESIRILTMSLAEKDTQDRESRERFRVLANELLETSKQNSIKNDAQLAQIRQLQEALARLEKRPPPPRIVVTPTPPPDVHIPPQEPPVVIVPPPPPPVNECVVNLLGIKLLC